jgi:hypothetical protein
MIHFIRLAIPRLAIPALLVLSTQVLAADEQCLAAMRERVGACTSDCVTKARAAMDPSVPDMAIGRVCTKNCLKIEMFHGRSCPD